MTIPPSVAAFVFGNLAVASVALAAMGANDENALPSVAAASSACPIFRDGFEAADAAFQMLPAWLAAAGMFEFVTPGGYTIKINMHTVTVTDAMGMNTVQHWGDPHENLNGKHLKDWGGEPGWDGARRSLLLGDGSKVTMESNGPQGLILRTSIYAGGANVQFDNVANETTHRGVDPFDTQQRERAQHDGETARFLTDAATGIATYDNVYNENAQFTLVPATTPLGTTGGCDNPHQVNDLYDDPRLGHT